jgi:hypothetical protein
MKNSINNSVLALLLLTISLGAGYGQGAMKMKKEKMKVKKIAFISKKLDLTPQEAEKFWPIYNEETAKIEQIFSEIRSSFVPVSEMTDEEALQKANAIMELESKIIVRKKAMIQRLKKVIPGKKILELMQTEKQFRRQMLKEMKRKRMLNKKIR